MNNVAFITGIMGQDGTYLKDILLKNNFTVIGFDKNISTIKSSNDKLFLLEENLSDYQTVLKLFTFYKPQYVFNLAGVSNVFDPWSNLTDIIESNIKIPQNFIECILTISPQTVLCQASSCLVFGNTNTTIQTENTLRAPLYPYGLSKNFVDGLIKDYREHKNLKLCSAIFYNHDSPYRGEGFFIKKLILFAKQINKNSKKKNFYNLNVLKDLGFAGDYMEAFFLMSQQKKFDDYIVSSGKLTNLMDVVNQVSLLSGHDLMNYIEINSNVEHSKITLFGDNSKIEKELGWKPKTTYSEVVKKIWDNS